MGRELAPQDGVKFLDSLVASTMELGDETLEFSTGACASVCVSPGCVSFFSVCPGYGISHVVALSVPVGDSQLWRVSGNSESCCSGALTSSAAPGISVPCKEAP